MQTETQTGLKITPLGWEETREILRPLFKSREHWILVCHIHGSRLIQEIERRYYLGDKNADFTLITGFWRGQRYALVAAKKKYMRPYQLASLLRQTIAGFKISDREMESRDFLIPAPPQFLADAFALGTYLFNETAELAVAA